MLSILSNNEEIFYVWSFSFVQCSECLAVVSDFVGHHVSYEPEILTFVCHDCHAVVHPAKNRERLLRTNSLKKEGYLKRRISYEESEIFRLA